MENFENPNARRFWRSQATSRHRDGSDVFYRQKAEEHARLFASHERNQSCVDLGCGAGELLVHLKKLVNVITAVDYSGAMLEEARQRLHGLNLRLIEAGASEYARIAEEKVWISTGAVNQYLDRESMDRFLDLFVTNTNAESLFLFDCVDPARFALLHFGIAYPSPPTPEANILKRFQSSSKMHCLRLLTAWRLVTSGLCRPGLRLGNASIGFGYPPSYWREAGTARKLDVTFFSSQAYEYRFHAILRKLWP